MSGLSSSRTATAKTILGISGSKTSLENTFDRITRLLTKTFGTSSAFIAIKNDDGNLQVRATRGIDVSGPQDSAFLSPDLLMQDQVLLVFDARQDPRFALDTWVIQRRVRFFASCPLQHEDGSIRGILGVLDEKPCRPDQDQLHQLTDLAHLTIDAITLRKQPPRALPPSEGIARGKTKTTAPPPIHPAQYDRLLSGLPLPLIGVDAEAKIVTWNPTCAQTLGFPPNEAHGQSLETYLALPADQQQIAKLVDRVFKRRRIPNLALTFKAKKGDLLRFKCRILPFYNEEGEVTQCIFVALDLGEQDRVEKELAETKARSRLVSELTSDLAYSKTLQADYKVEFEWASGRLADLAGLTGKLNQSIDHKSLVHADDWPALKKQYSAPAIGQRNVREYRFALPDGKYCWVRDASEVTLYDPETKQTRIFGALQDITAEREAAKAKAEPIASESNGLEKIKSTLISNISHELRTPLTSILGFSEIVLDQVEGEQREFMTLIHGSADRLMQTLTSIVDLAQLNGEQVAYEPKEVNLAAHSATMIDEFREIAKEKDLALKLKVNEKGETTAWIDEAAHTRVMKHLLDNAIKFTRKGSVTIALSSDEQRATIEIRDTGIGIAEGFIPHLFQDFHQESAGLNRSHQGSGLGLAICHRLIEQMQGEIDVTSKKGKGSTFRIRYPRTSKA